MRINKIVYFGLSIMVLTCLSKPPSPTAVGEEGKMKIHVSLFFGENDDVKNFADVKHKAEEAVRAKGWMPVKEGTCGISVVLAPEPKCVVILTEGLFKKTQQVIFDGNGKILSVEQGPEEKPEQKK
jgi:hypothetical protein